MKLHYYLISLITFVNVCIFSCTKDISWRDSVKSVSLEEAKLIFNEWKYQTNAKSIDNFKLSQRTDTIPADSLFKEPLWQEAISYYDDEKAQFVMEVPLRMNIPTAYIVPPDTAKFQPKTIAHAIKRSLIIVRNSNDSIGIAVCNILASGNYFHSNRTNELNTYKEKDPNFEGWVLYTDWEDYFMEGYVFEEGECTEEITKMVLEIDTTQVLQVRLFECWLRKYCRDKWLSSLGMWQSEFDERWGTESVPCWYVIVCFWRPDPGVNRPGGGYRGGRNGSSGSGGSWGSGSGGGGGGNNNNGSFYIDRVNHYNTNCGVNLINDYEDIALGCQFTTSKNGNGTHEEFDKCVTQALLDQGFLPNEGCIKDLLNPTNEELEMIGDLLGDEVAFNIDDVPEENLNDCEKALIWKYPVCALAIRSNKALAESKTVDLFGKSRLNDCSDAFRHAYFNALNTKSCGYKNSKTFADAHEYCHGQIGNDLETEMDLHNNDHGRNITVNNPNATNLELANLVMTELNQGLLKFIYPRNANGKVNLNSQVVYTFQNCN